MRSKFLQQIGVGIDVTNSLAAIPPQNNDGAAIAGIAIKRNGAQSAYVILDVAAATGTPTAAVAAVKLQDNSITTAGTFGDFLTLESALDIDEAATHKVYAINLSGAAEYVRLTFDSTYTAGTSPANILCANIVFGDYPVDPPQSVTILG